MNLFIFTCQLRPKRIFPQPALRFFGYDHPWQWLAEKLCHFRHFCWHWLSDANFQKTWTQISSNISLSNACKSYISVPQKDMHLPLTLHLLRHTSTDWSLVFAPPILVCLPGMRAEATAQRRVRKVDTSSWNRAKHGWQTTLQNMAIFEFNKWWHPWVV